MLGDQRLVGGDHVLAVLDGGKHQLTGGLNAANELYQNVDIRVCRHRKNIAGKTNITGITGRIVAAGTDMGNFNRTPHAASNIPRVTLQYIHGA